MEGPMNTPHTQRATDLAHELGAHFGKRCAGHDAADTFVAEHYAALKEQRVLAALVPAELGGGGWTHRDMSMFLRTLAGYCGSTALALAMHQHLVAAHVWNHRHGKPGRAVLEQVAREQIVLVTTGGKDWM